MVFFDIDKLKRDSKQDNLYDLFVPTFTYIGPVDSSQFQVTIEEDFRLDLVSQKQYRTDEYVDILCSVNLIDNPLNIMEGDTLQCPSIGNISAYRTDDAGRATSIEELNIDDTTTSTDENRTKYVSQNYKITPTSLPEPKDSLRVVGDQIIINN